MTYMRRAVWLFMTVLLLVPMMLTASSGFHETQLTVKPGHLEVGGGQLFFPEFTIWIPRAHP